MSKTTTEERKMTTNKRKHSDGIYISAFQTWCDSGQRYSAVAHQMGVSPTTAKRWVRIGADLWQPKSAK